MTLKNRNVCFPLIGFAPLAAVLTIILTVGASLFCQAEEEKVGLLILTHGSPSPRWNESITQLAEEVRSLNDGRFAAIEWANMEFAQPDTTEGIERLENAGCDRIIVVPAFIFPTSHSHFDVPTVLGLYTSPSTRATLEEEGGRAARAKVPITMTQTLSEGDLLAKYIAEEIESNSTNSAEEVLLIIAHGDGDHAGLINPVMKKLCTSACGRYGFSEGNWAYCEMGQSYNETVRPLLEKYSDEGKRCVVVGLYLATSAGDINDISERMKAARRAGTPAAADAAEGQEAESGPGAVFSRRPLIKSPQTAPFVFKIASEAL